MAHSIFTIVGPVMVGPSSSHTAGAVRLGNVARALFGELPEKVTLVLYQSFGEVYHGHGTDKALVAGILGFPPHDKRLLNSFCLAEESGMHVHFVPKPHAGERYHPNTVKFYFEKGDRKMMVLGSSLGGGLIEIVRIDDMPVSLTGEHDVIILTAKNDVNVLDLVYGVLHPVGAKMLQLFSHEKKRGGDFTRYVVEVSAVPPTAEAVLHDTPGITRVSIIPQISMWSGVTDDHVPETL
jgi:L-serine dehydratase